MIRFKQGAGHLRPNRVLAAAAAVVVVGAGLSFTSIGTAVAAPGCSVAYTANSWNTGFTASIDITNSGDALTSWALEFDYAGNQQAGAAWGGTLTQSGKHVKIVNAAWNGTLAAGAKTNVGFNGTYSGTNTAPTAFTLNGTACNGGTTNPTRRARSRRHPRPPRRSRRLPTPPERSSPAPTSTTLTWERSGT